MKLSDIKKGASVTIQSIQNDRVKAQAVRFGISEGERVICMESLRKGPVVIKKNLQEIALGRNIAEHIYVSV